MAKSSTIDVDALCKSMQASRHALETYRRTHYEATKKLAGDLWSEETSVEPATVVNLLDLYVETISRSLIAKNPRVMLSTFQREHKPTVGGIESWANKEIERMQLEETLRRVVINALFSVGICKVSLANPAEAAVAAWGLGAGQPFVTNIDLDDFVCDMNARCPEEFAYAGHRVRVPLEAAKKWLGKKAKDLQPSDIRQHNEQGDDRIGNLGRGNHGATSDFEPMVDLWEVYVPRHRVVLTLPDDYVSAGMESPDGEALRIQKWVGPYCGPYHYLGYGIIPGSPVPKGPIQNLLHLHNETNAIWRKIIRMMARVKVLTIYQAGQDGDAQRINDADDGATIPLSRPDAVRQLTFGAEIIQPLVAIATELRGLFNLIGGNLELMGGRGQQAKTATQEKLLNENAGAAVEDKQARTINFVSRVLNSLVWYAHHDPYNVMRSKYNLPGMPEFSLNRQVTPQMRQQIPWEDLEVMVDPYSMQHDTPGTRLQHIMEVLTQIWIPLADKAQAAGVTMDFNRLMQIAGKYRNLPELPEILTVQDPPAEGGAGSAHQRTMPTSTNREYTRHNTSEATSQGQDKNLVQTALAQAPPNGQPKMAG